MGSLAQEEYDLMKDSKYRVYVSAVDKALKNFEYTSEWADLISALGKLNKVLVNNMKFPVIPRRIKISKRLAQCMHPALPSGVHLKALETYDAIFKCMGTNRLAHELFIYSAGLFPLLGHAAMNVRLLLLTVYETHFIPLGERLRPALSGFLSGVLPGLESGSDHFDSTNALLEKVCEGVGAAHFYSCMWECLACNSSTRFPAISFVLSHFNKRLSMADQIFIMGKDVDVLVTGLCACMRDSSVLVQRCALELLLVGFPMHSSQLLKTDMVRLIIAGLSTILRRDMSLNRRLYAWLLGSEVNTAALKSDQVLIKKSKLVARSDENFIPYFEQYSRDLLIQAIRITLAESAKETPPDLKPYRLLMSLLDKAEIGPVILDDILYDVFRTLYLSCGDRKTEKHFEEILKSANMLFSALEPYYIWEYVGILYGEACNKVDDVPVTCNDNIVKLPGSDNADGICTNLLEVCTLTQYLLDTLPLETYVDTTSEHLPSLFLKITELLTENSDLLLIDEIMNSICLCKKIVSRIQTVVTNTPKIDVENISSRLSVSMMEITRQPNELRGRNDKLPNLEKSKSDSKLNDANKGLTDNTLHKVFAESSRSLKYNENVFSENVDKDSNSTTTTTNEGDKYSDESLDEESNCILKNAIDEKTEMCTYKTSRNSTPDPINTEKQSLLEKCIRCYEIFFVQFISQRLLNLGTKTQPTHIDDLFKSLLLLDDQSPFLEADNSVNILESMLNNTLTLTRSQNIISLKQESKCASQNALPKPLISDQSNYSALQRAVKLACRLLVELSTFPTYIPQELNINLNQNFDGMQIPEWLKVLVLCACFLKNAPDLQLPAVSTVLDLITLLRTQLECNDSDGLGPRKSGVGVTSVVMIPLLRQWHVEYLEKSTKVFQILAYSLWDHLACPTLEDKLMTWASLLHQLHNCLPTNNVVEMVLGESMNSEDPGRKIESFHRFSTLWHLGRDMEGKACSRAMRAFDKTLLKMLDNLQLPESSPLKLFAASWVMHSLLRGDIHRLLDPVLSILLDPLTARMSILHVSIQHSSTRLMQRTSNEYDNTKHYDNSTSPSSKIYAISSVDGNVIYHVSDNVQSSMSKTTSKSFTKKILNPLKSRKLYSLTASKDKNNSKSNIIGKHYTAKDVLSSSSGLTVSTQNISLFVNPFSTTDVCSDDNSVEDPASNLGSKQDLFNASRFKRSDSEYGLCSDDKRSSISSNTSIKLSSNIDIVQFTCNKTDRKTLLIKSKQSSSESTSSNSYESSHDLSHTSYENNNFESTISQKSENDLIFRSKSVSGTSSKSMDLPLTPSKSVENISKSEKSTSSNLNEIVSSNVLTTDLTNRTAGMIEQFEMSLHEIKDGSLYNPEICVASEFELSTAAEEYFNESSSLDVVKGVLNSIIDKVCDIENVKILSKSEYDKNMSSKSSEINNLSKGVHQLHTHMLLYCEVYDSNRTLYALQTLRNEILTNTRVFLCSAATTGIANVPKGIQLLNLLARHKKSIYGHGFYGDISNTEYIHSYRSCMYLEVLITICLHFARSYYPNLGNVKLTDDEILGNRKVQLASVELLMLICTELISIVRDSGKGFSCYIADLLNKCKVQKIILHCVISSVHIMKTDSEKNVDQISTFTEEIIHFNDGYVLNRNYNTQMTNHTEGFQIQILRLLLSLIMLEYQVHIHKGDDATNTPVAGKESPTNTVKINHLKYVPNLRIPQQPMFLAAVLMALQLEYMRHLHQHWTTLLTSALPYMGSSLTHIVISVIHQLCTNIEKISSLYHSGGNEHENCCLPPDYTVTQLEALTVVCHYCLLDSNQQLSHVFNQSFSHGLTTGMSSTNPGQIFNNLIHVFMPTPLSQDAATSKGSQLETHLQARRVVLSHMPRIIASMAALWENVTSLKDWEHRSCVLGNPDVVKHQLLEFLSPVSLHHGINFLAAIAVAWLERRDTTSTKKVLPVANTNQQVLVYLVSEIRVMPMDSLVQTVHQVLKSPPPIHGAKQDLSLDVGILELFYWYMQTASSAQLSDIWPSLLGLLKDGLTLNPPGQFLIIAILNEYVQKCPQFVEKRDQRDLHDITSKIVESISQIAGCCLEQTTWLRRNLAVKEEPQINSTVTDDKDGSHSPSLNGQRGSQMQSVQAQSVLAEILATLLDVAYGSQDKEKVVAILTTLMYNITPYLKNHTQYNAPAFKACCHLLSSLSGYQYTRKAWRKDVFDLLLDTALFQMESSCLVYWRTIIDNLMTHDNSTFRDFMARVSMTQSGSLSIFSSREQEYEQRAQLLRRLAFVIFCSEIDQYHKYMPEIQEQLASSLRLLQVVPSVQANVFLCFRVLLLRMSPQHVTSLWPIIISEMVQVFLHIEQELATYSEEFRTNSSFHIRLLSALDYSWVTNSNNGLHAHGHPHWLQLQLATAKLLDLALVLPATALPQFQMYRWAFVSDSDSSVCDVLDNELHRSASSNMSFVPHVTRIARLMDARYADSQIETIPCKPGELLLTNSSIKSLQELHSFFKTLSMRWHAHRMPDNCLHWDSPVANHSNSSLAQLETVLENDFLEKLSER